MTGIRTAIRNWCSSRHITLIGESNQTSRASAKAREDKQAAEYVERLRRALTELGSAYQLLLEQIEARLLLSRSTSSRSGAADDSEADSRPRYVLGSVPGGRSSEWRDSESNRGHYDFQSRIKGDRETRRFAGRSRIAPFDGCPQITGDVWGFWVWMAICPQNLPRPRRYVRTGARRQEVAGVPRIAGVLHATCSAGETRRAAAALLSAREGPPRVRPNARPAMSGWGQAGRLVSDRRGALSAVRPAGRKRHRARNHAAPTNGQPRSLKRPQERPGTSSCPRSPHHRSGRCALTHGPNAGFCVARTIFTSAPPMALPIPQNTAIVKALLNEAPPISSAAKTITATPQRSITSRMRFVASMCRDGRSTERGLSCTRLHPPVNPRILPQLLHRMRRPIHQMHRQPQRLQHHLRRHQRRHK